MVKTIINALSIILIEKTIYKKRNLNDSFNPFSFAESCSDDVNLYNISIKLIFYK